MAQIVALTQEELIIFCKELHLVLNSSIGIVDGLESVVEGTKRAAVRDSLGISLEALNQHEPISRSLELSGLFSQYMISMIEIGEKTGKLDQVMLSLATYYEKDLKLRRQIKSSIRYPIIVSSMVTAIVLVMVTKVMPVFEEVFRNLGGNVPSSVDFVTGVGSILVGFVFVLFIVIVVLVGMLLILFNSEKHRPKVQRLLSKIPGVRNIYEKYQTAKFANSLSLLISSGYDLHESLELTEKVTGDYELKRKIAETVEKLERGESLSKALEEMHIFRGVHARWIRLSVHTGQLDHVLHELSEEYTKDVDFAIMNLIGVLEPSLVGATSVIIGGILLVVMLPLLGLMSSIG